jgi:hypothetical protein
VKIAVPPCSPVSTCERLRWMSTSGLKCVAVLESTWQLPCRSEPFGVREIKGTRVAPCCSTWSFAAAGTPSWDPMHSVLFPSLLPTSSSFASYFCDNSWSFLWDRLTGKPPYSTLHVCACVRAYTRILLLSIYGGLKVTPPQKFMTTHESVFHLTLFIVHSSRAGSLHMYRQCGRRITAVCYLRAT